MSWETGEWGIRLPTEWEWQWAAQAGDEGREYPWGAWDNQPRANTTEAKINDRSTAVGMYPDGAAACGALDMAGNLWEWCLNDHEDINRVSLANGATKVVRGGSFYNHQVNARVFYRDSFNPNDWDYLNGFRVVVGSSIRGL